ncbi:MAG TPA: N-acetyltransferase [Candidatus Acidoferrales bacterium]
MSEPAARAASSAIRVREYEARDFDVLCEIDQRCYEPAIAYSRREMHAYLNASGAECVVAESLEGIAGFCIAAHKKEKAYIVTIDVLEAFRKQGVGSALLTEAERRLAARGVRRIALDTATDNFSAISFWQKHGYRKIGVRRGYYPNDRDAFAMVKSPAHQG